MAAGHAAPLGRPSPAPPPPPLPEQQQAQVQRVRLGHGGGGTLMTQLIDTELRCLYRDPERPLHDATRLQLPHGRLAFSTDSSVVAPLEFPGGDIGRLAVIGTANDLAMAGARPRHLSVALILEEGLELPLLRRIVGSLRAAADLCDLSIETGDTKVVERGRADGLYISTSGIGVVESRDPIGPLAVAAGDALLVSGDLGRHGLAILAARHGLELDPPLLSDCAPLWPLVEELMVAGVQLHCLRDLTRGGLAAALQELAVAAGLEFHVEEQRLPFHPSVERGCAVLGLEPLHLACEGRLLAIVPDLHRQRCAAILERRGGGWIGSVRRAPTPGGGQVVLRTAIGAERLLRPPSGELLPRIC
ncbi:MAG: hydrogenase expression/formation protein HypE [Cyanobium sp.]|jgi:hydrogenase expression/formation protein HypE|nr:hydrogenase expression/formation protein HypE [Synechococcaceae cyanobacterium]